MGEVKCEFCQEPIEGDGVKPVADRDWYYHPECVEVLKIEHGMVMAYLKRQEAKKASESKGQDAQ